MPRKGCANADGDRQRIFVTRPAQIWQFPSSTAAFLLCGGDLGRWLANCYGCGHPVEGGASARAPPPRDIHEWMASCHKSASQSQCGWVRWILTRRRPVSPRGSSLESLAHLCRSPCALQLRGDLSLTCHCLEPFESESIVSKKLLAGMWLLVCVSCADKPSAAPARERAQEDVLTEHRPLHAEKATGKLGDDCKQSGSSGCLSGLCLHTQPDPSEGYVCSAKCQSSAECPRDWACGVLHPGTPERYCIPARVQSPLNSSP